MAQTDPKRPSALPPPMGAPSNIVTEIVDQITEKQSRATCRPDPLPPTDGLCNLCLGEEVEKETPYRFIIQCTNGESDSPKIG